MNHNDQKPKSRTWTREDNQLALYCYFRSNPPQRGYRKRMIEILQEYACFQTTSQRLADEVRTILRKGWFSDLEIIEIHQKINYQLGSNAVSGTTRVVKLKQPKRKELPSLENGKATLPNNAQPSNPKETLSQELKVNQQHLKRIKHSEKTTLASLRNIEWRTVKTETNKINQVPSFFFVPFWYE